MLAVPVSLVGTFAAFAMMGFSINTLTMFGLVLAIGIVVDDAIVVVEAVEHHIEHGLTPLEATKKAMVEVSGPVIGIAMVLISVFVPVTFLGGITGQLYRQFAMTLSISVALSAIVALSLTPALCVMILRPRKKMRGPLGWLINGFNKIFDATTKGYVGIVRILTRRTIIGLALLARGLLRRLALRQHHPRRVRSRRGPGSHLHDVHPAGRRIDGSHRRRDEARRGVRARSSTA